jgi:hypothetical protein
MVLSENTMPQPKVLSAWLRSITVISLAGLACFIRIEKYKPAGPPPRHTMRITVSFLGDLSNIFLF